LSKITKQKIKNILLTLLVLGILIPATGCHAAADLFDPETYNFDDGEPWERNIQKKPVKPKSAGEEL
jgi:hypothetical protein